MRVSPRFLVRTFRWSTAGGAAALTLALTLGSGTALFALLDAGLGVSAVVSHDVTRRRAELALRLALGASPGQLRRSIAAGAVLIVGPGLLGGALRGD